MVDHNRIKNSSITFCVSPAAFAILFVLVFAAPPLAQAQTFKVIYNFIGQSDGVGPYAGLTMDAAGNFYGTTAYAGLSGSVFKLTPKGSGWVFSRLYRFAGAGPWARVVFGPDGTLYGTTLGGGASGSGTVFNLSAPATNCKAVLCSWTEIVLYNFTGRNDGGNPEFDDLTFDQEGNLYGTTFAGGSGGGVVYQLTPSGSGWTENVLHTFGELPNDGYGAAGDMIFDNAGNLYGTTVYGGSSGAGAVFQLKHSGSGWTENVLYSFQGGNDGAIPLGLILDSSGNLYGTTADAGQGGGGTVFELRPSGSGWNYTQLYNFTGTAGYQCGPFGTLVMDREGNLYGTTRCDGAYNEGSVFKLTPSGSGWTYMSLHDFTGSSDGGSPFSNVIFDADGNLYGTASAGGSLGFGVVWEITP